MKTAFFGEQGLKDLVMEQLREHRRLDQIVQGRYWEHGKGCNLGCLTHNNNNAHEAAERMFGIPQRIGYWLEAVFECLPKEDCAAWVIDSAEAIPVGADLSLAHHELAYWLLGPESPSAEGNNHPTVRDAILRIRNLHDRARRGELVESAAWSAARSAAWSAAQNAAWSAARSAAWTAVWSAAENAERSAAWSAAENAARSASWRSIAAKSIEIFRACPVAKCDECETCVAETMVYLDNNRKVFAGV